MKKILIMLLAVVFACTALTVSLAEAPATDWYTTVLSDEAVAAEYPCHAIVDINGDGIPVLIVSTTEDSFITFEDKGIVYLCDQGAPKQVMEVGGQGGEIFYANMEEHTLTHFSRLSGEGHYEVFHVADGALEPVTQIDYYAPRHGPVDSDQPLYYQDGETIDEAAANELIDLYAGDNAIFYAPATQNGAATIAPQFDGLDTNEGTYPAAFDRDGLKDGALTNVRVFTEDWYDIVDVAQMKVGDTFEAEGKTVIINSLETDENNNININGGMDEDGGYTLTTEEDTNGWTTLMWDDFCICTERGTFDLALAENVRFTDGWDIEKEPVTAEGIEAVTAAIMASENDSFDEYNTTLVIEGGKVVEINRRYVP